MQRIENSMILSNRCIAICNTEGMCGGLLGPKVKFYFWLCDLYIELVTAVRASLNRLNI